MRLALVCFIAPLLSACVHGIAHPPRPTEEGAAFRVVTWNVAESSFVRRPEVFHALLRSVDADVFVLDEVGGETAPVQLLQVLRGLRSEADTVWHLAWGRGGDYQRTVIASRTPVEPLPEFAPLAFPDAAARILERAPDSLRPALRRGFSLGVAANGAVVRVGQRRVLVAGVDLWARGGVDSWEEMRRRVEAAAIRDGVRRALTRLEAQGRPVDAVVVGGDMNLISGRAPLDTLLAPPGTGWNALALAPAVHADQWSVWTWDGRRTPFASQRMDVLLYSPDALVVTAARVVDSEAMTPDALARAGLRADASASLSRHRPIVVDFAWSPRRP